MVGTCQFCGQIVEVGDTLDLNPDEIAYQFCSCGAARYTCRVEAQIKDALDRIDELFGEEAGAHGFPPVKEASVLELLRGAVVEVAGNLIGSMTLTIPGGGTAIIRMGSKSEIKVSRRVVRSETLEANM